MSAKKEIKIPPAQIFREFRMRFMPLAVFACGLVATFYLWNATVVGPTLIGEVEAVQAPVTTLEAGILTNLLVRPMQVVQKGEPIAELIVTDVRSASGQVQDLRGRIALSQLEINSAIDRERIAFDYQALSMNMLRFRSELAGAKAELPTAEAALKRNEIALKEKVLSYNEYELSLRLRDSLVARIKELETLVGEAQTRLEQAQNSAQAFTNFSSGDSLAAVMKRLKDERTSVDTVGKEPVILRAPITGTIGSILHREGENVPAGEVILTIHALEADRIVAYMRQGASVTPTKGMQVRVRCRSKLREEAVSKVEEVGFRYESITNQAHLRPGMLFELGMPIGVTMPPGFKTLLRPGELVDLALEP